MSGHPRGRIAVFAAAAVTVFAAVLFVLYARGGGPVPRAFSFLSPGAGALLAPSNAEETVLRSLRLAGIERAVVGEERGSAIVRLEAPTVSSAGDVTIAWQTGMATLAQAYPRADEYVVQVFAGGEGYLEVVAEGGAARAAIDADDPAALLGAAELRLLPEEEAGDG